MIQPSSTTRIWLAAGATDMRRGFNGLARQVQEVLQHDPFSGQLFVFRDRRGDLIKILAWHNMDLCLFAKRLDRGRFTLAASQRGRGVADTSPAVDAARGH